jgi:hypothetical protein
VSVAEQRLSLRRADSNYSSPRLDRPVTSPEHMLYADRAARNTIEPGILLFILPHVVAALVFGFLLYWAMQPIVKSNQGAPHLNVERQAPTFLRRRQMADTEQTELISIETAQQENRLLDLANSPTVGEDRPGLQTNATNIKSAPPQKVRRRTTKHRDVPKQAPYWASRNPHDAGLWFR